MLDCADFLQLCNSSRRALLGYHQYRKSFYYSFIAPPSRTHWAYVLVCKNKKRNEANRMKAIGRRKSNAIKTREIYRKSVIMNYHFSQRVNIFLANWLA